MAEFPGWLAHKPSGSEMVHLSLLSDAVACAAELEASARPLDSQAATDTGVLLHVLYGNLVRAIRLAYSIVLQNGSLESTLQLRALLETWITVQFIACDPSKPARARSYINYYPVALIGVLQELPTADLSADDRHRLNLLDKHREGSEKDFRVKRTCKACGESQNAGWDWDGRTGSARGRLDFVTKALEGRIGPPLASKLIYSLYRHTSPYVHGDILSVEEVLLASPFGQDVRREPRPNAGLAIPVVLLAAWLLLDVASALDAAGGANGLPARAQTVRTALENELGPKVRGPLERGFAAIQARLPGALLQEGDGGRYLISPDRTRLVEVVGLGYDYFTGSLGERGFTADRRVGFSPARDDLAERFLRGESIDRESGFVEATDRITGD
ncbi:MAG TPA: DUF5677 domain-containing protein [Myxococcota bacterium]|nr:DUF5677 domain-containing protein [Myxococcota bacterium]